MKINLAGYNLDKYILDKAKIPKEINTPETITAAYARISRNSSPINELRKQSIKDVKKARKSNETILYSYGHSSIAENAVLNFDIIDVSRLAVESIQNSRLCSYLEKSQRYQKLKNDYVIPKEIIELGFKNDFKDLIKLQLKTYEKILKKLSEEYLKNVSLNKKVQRLNLINKAKEDARYVTSLSMNAQMGMTLNARNLEYMIKKLASHPLKEVKEISKHLYNESVKLIPSLIKYVEPKPEDKDAKDELESLAWYLTKNKKNGNSAEHQMTPNLVQWTFNGDIILIATILFETTNHCWLSCYDIAKQFSDQEKRKLFKSVIKNINIHDQMPRLFELIELTYDLIVSSSCYAQLKRHRMSTQLVKPYNLTYGTTLPESIKKYNLEYDFNVVMDASEKLYNKISNKNKKVAEYCLTQAHRRRVLLKMNAREMYHFIKLRNDSHAQWDIRNIANQMLTLSLEKLPLTMLFACGKNEFTYLKNIIFK